MKKICPNCGVENEENAKFCMNCAAKLSEEITENTTKNENKFYRKLIPIIIIVMVFIAILSIILINKYKEKEKAALIYKEKESAYNDFQKSNLITTDLNNLQFKVPSNWSKGLTYEENKIAYIKEDVAEIIVQDLGKSENIIDNNGNMKKDIVVDSFGNEKKLNYDFLGKDTQHVYSCRDTVNGWDGYAGVVGCNSEAFLIWCDVKEGATNDPKKVAKAFFDTVDFSNYKPNFKLIKIAATYSGDTSADTEITADSGDITVTAYYDDGDSEVLDNSDWTMDDTATLEPEKTTKLEIYYQGVTCILKIKCSTKINKERSLKKFIKRYNAMADIMKKEKNITVKKLKEEDLDENQIETGIGATIIFNQSAEDTDCRYDIKSFMWSKSPWAFTDSEVLLANIYCCLAGYSSDNDYTTIGKIVSQIGEEATTGVYGSVHTGKYMYNMSVIKKEMTVGGQLEN